MMTCPFCYRDYFKCNIQPCEKKIKHDNYYAWFKNKDSFFKQTEELAFKKEKK